MKAFIAFLFIAMLAFFVPHCYGGADTDVGPPSIEIGLPTHDATVLVVAPAAENQLLEARSAKLQYAATELKPTASDLNSPYWPTGCSISHLSARPVA